MRFKVYYHGSRGGKYSRTCKGFGMGNNLILYTGKGYPGAIGIEYHTIDRITDNYGRILFCADDWKDCWFPVSGRVVSALHQNGVL